MGIDDLTNHLASVPASGAGAVLAAWLAWRLWRRLLRAVIACVIVGLVVYLAFPGLVHQLGPEQRGPATGTTSDH